jgi:hypothetical protein
MNEQSNFLLYRQYERYVKCVSVISILVGIAVLFGYAFHIVALKSITPIWLPMKPNTAICFILSGIAIWYLKNRNEITSQQRVIATICSLLILLFSILTFCEYLFNFNLGIDQLLFHVKLQIDDILYPGRTSVATTVSLFFLSVSLLFMDSRFSVWIYQISACIVISIAFTSLLGYFYNINTVYGFTYFTKMALHTSFTFILLGFAILLMRPDVGMIEELLSDSSGGKSMRNLLPLTFIITTFVGFLENLGERFNLFSPAFGDNIQVTGTIILFAAAVIINAKFLDKDELRRKNEEKR